MNFAARRSLVMFSVILLCGVVALFELPTTADETRPGCIDCANDKLGFAASGDAKKDGEAWKAVQAAAEARQRSYEAAGLKLNRARMQSWHGTKVVASEGVSDGDLTLHTRISAVLAREAGTPEDRLNHFQRFFGTDNEFQCVGWEGVLKSATSDADGCDAEIEVRPKLMRAQGGIVFTPMSRIETWRVDNAGKVTYKGSEPGRGPGFIFVD